MDWFSVLSGVVIGAVFLTIMTLKALHSKGFAFHIEFDNRGYKNGEVLEGKFRVTSKVPFRVKIFDLETRIGLRPEVSEDVREPIRILEKGVPVTLTFSKRVPQDIKPNGKTGRVPLLFNLKTSFGNFVIERSLKLASPDER